MSWIDLTHTLTNALSGVSIMQAKTIEKDGWNAKNLNIYSHAGTHIDAPVHFGIDGPTIDEYTIDQLSGIAHVIDIPVSDQKKLLEVSDISKQNIQLVKGESVILKTGWNKMLYIDPTAYRDNLPRISEDLAHWFVEKQVKMIAVEAPSVSDVNNIKEVTAVHQILFRGGIIIIEGICNLEAIHTKKVELMALPLKIQNGDGAPARVIARPIE